MCSGHPWLANYHDVKIPPDMIVYRLVKAYIASSSLRKAALGVSWINFVVIMFSFLEKKTSTSKMSIIPDNWLVILIFSLVPN